MIIIAIVLWYLLGLFGGLFIMHLENNQITLSDLLFSLTLGGLGGLLTIIICIASTSIGDTKIL